MKLRIAVLLALGMLPWAGLHAHESATAVFRVTAKVVEFCDITTNDLALDAVQSGTLMLRATCTPDTTYFVGLTKGATPGATTKAGASGIAAGALTVGVGTGEPVDHTLFGGVPASQIIPPVDSGDTLSVRVYY